MERNEGNKTQVLIKEVVVCICTGTESLTLSLMKEP